MLSDSNHSVDFDVLFHIDIHRLYDPVQTI
jgi:hypothetical protein